MQNASRPNNSRIWRLVPFIAVLCAGAAARDSRAEDWGAYALRPGVIKKCSFSQSAIFPGTEREVVVFVPAQYDGAKPTCVYVKADGYNPKEKTILEEMIAAREMPVTIGVFVKPGIVPAPMPGTVGRRNRCFEYDGMGDNNVRFLVEELLPFVAKEFDLKL